jgi:hypothetical protein
LNFLGTADENIVWDATKEVVPFAGGDDGSELVLQVVTTSGLETNAVKVKPGSPEDTSEPVDMTVEGTTGVVAAGNIHDALNCIEVSSRYYNML